VPGATHASHQPKPEWSAKFKGKFDMGWNALREQIFANQKRLGVIPANTQLTPWPDDLPKWDTLDAESKKLFARMRSRPAISTRARLPLWNGRLNPSR
jgi:arylsulfatase A-like enzyme